jgi:hypothetical protein
MLCAECFHVRSALTPASWVCRLYSTSAAILLVSLLVFTVISRNDTNRMVMLEFAVGNRTQLIGNHAFNLSSAYVVGLVFAAVAHVVVALAPSILHPHLAAGRNPARWIILLLSAPLLQAVTLVGIAEVTDVWAVFSVASVTGLGLLMLFLLETAQHGQCTVLMVAVGVGGTFVGYWFLIWEASGTRDTFTLGICCALSVLLVGLFASTYNCAAHPYKREAIMQSTTLLFLVGMPWLWAASSKSATSTTEMLTTFIFVLVSGGVCTVWALLSTERIVDAATKSNDGPTGPLLTGSDDESGEDAPGSDTEVIIEMKAI